MSDEKKPAEYEIVSPLMGVWREFGFDPKLFAAFFARAYEEAGPFAVTDGEPTFAALREPFGRLYEVVLSEVPKRVVQ